MSWLRTIVGAALLLPSIGCTMCCAPYDTCGPLCNGECGCGCPETARAGGYYHASPAAHYEEVVRPRSTEGPTLAPPRELPPQEAESPMEETIPDPSYDYRESPPAEMPSETPEAAEPDESLLPPGDEELAPPPSGMDEDLAPPDDDFPPLE